MSESLIHLESVTKVFVTDEVETHALAGVHLDINKGEYLSIAGPSGCGKSTLLAILGLLDSPSEGAYTLNGKPVFGQPDSQVSLFKLDDDGKGATRVTVKLGLASVNSIEIKDGLIVGDQVILSDMSAQDQSARIRLN
jgi:predicted ABC-type transport system involved in lysophospholipase L1 biosynthesis ATPase subunit